MRFETLRRLRYLACRDDWAFSFDLQDGYYALGLREDVREYCTINVRGTLWRSAALPMGWSLSPYYFCILVNVMLGLEINLCDMRFTAPPDKLRRLSVSPGTCSAARPAAAACPPTC
eukprot:jgi/Tetstr1/459329/TSEL_004724.t1